MAAPFEKQYYNSSMQLYIEMFSAIMSKLKINTERGIMEVPLTMSRGHRNNLNKQQNTNSLPFATYCDGETFQIDKSATTSKLNRLSTPEARSDNRIPVIIPFEYNVKTKKYGEMLQIIEQIYGVFYPSLNGVVIDNMFLKQKQNVKIMLTGHSVQDNWEGEGTEPLSYSGAFTFDLYGFLYGYNYWVRGDGEDEDPILIKEVIIDRGLSMDVRWQDLDLWFTVDKDGVHYPPGGV